jgi:hypothetical protein
MNPNPPMPPQPPQPSVPTGVTAGVIIYTIIGVVIGLLVAAGAAKLSYDKYGSIGWAILAFIFSPAYYPYYAFFVSTRTSILGGRRK